MVIVEGGFEPGVIAAVCIGFEPMENAPNEGNPTRKDAVLFFRLKRLKGNHFGNVHCKFNSISKDWCRIC